MRAAAQYGGAKEWVEPIYEAATDLVYRLELGLLKPDDIEPPWDDILIYAKVGLEGRKADHMRSASNKSGSKGGSSGAVAVPLASQAERRLAIEQARAREAAKKGGQNG